MYEDGVDSAPSERNTPGADSGNFPAPTDCRQGAIKARLDSVGQPSLDKQSPEAPSYPVALRRSVILY